MKRFACQLLLMSLAAGWLATIALYLASFAAVLQIRHETIDRLLLIRLQDNGLLVDSIKKWGHNEGWSLNLLWLRGSSLNLPFRFRRLRGVTGHHGRTHDGSVLW